MCGEGNPLQTTVRATSFIKATNNENVILLNYINIFCRTPSSAGLLNGPSSSNNGSSGLSSEMEQVKQEILAEMKLEMKKLKQDILEGRSPLFNRRVLTLRGHGYHVTLHCRDRASR